MHLDDELALRCTDPECRMYEEQLRHILYQWQHFRVDMVVEPFIRVPKAICGMGFGIHVHEDTAVTDPTNDVLGHRYFNQVETDDDLDKLRRPEIYHDVAETTRRLAVAHELFDGLLDVRPWGADLNLSLWDPIATWMGVENACFALVDRPEFMHKLVGRMTDGYMSTLDQLEEQGLLCQPQSLIHCTGAWTDELPAPDYDPERPRTKDIWMMGLAQMFSTVSPRMFKEFEVDYAGRMCARFGLVYYGCCDPLDGKMNEVRLLPNVRKVSMSPWTNQERGAREIGNQYVFSRKPSPALLAWDTFNPENVREDLLTTRQVCEKYGCPLEIILKDISTVRYEPQRLFKWAEIAMQVAGGE
jgi:NADH:ubiquinone oxidoreductase subunit